MLYNKVYITQEDIERAKTELLYHLACARQRGEELVCCLIDIKDNKMVSKILSECSKLLKKMKKENKISVFLSNETFHLQNVEKEYLLNKYPEIQFDLLLSSQENAFLLVRL